MRSRERSNFGYLSLQLTMTNTCCWIFAVAAIADAMEHVPIHVCAVGYYSSNPQAHLNMGSSTQICYLIPFLYDLHQKEY